MFYIRLIRIFSIGLSFFLASNLFTLATEKNEKPIKTELSGYWTYYCKNYDQQRHCEIARKIDIKDKNETFLIVYKITKDTKFTRPFLKCENFSCLAVFKGNLIFKYSLKNYKKMKITFYVNENEEPISLTLEMNGFGEALNIVNQQLEFY